MPGGIDSFTKLILHCDGADGSTTFTDSSFVPHTVTAVGSVQVDIDQSVFGGASALFDGEDDRLELDGSSDFAFGTGDFVIDFRFRLRTAAHAQVLYDGRPDATNGAYTTIFFSTTDVVYFTDGTQQIFSGAVISIDTWYHVAIVRQGTSTRMFLNGVQVGSTYTDTSNYIISASRPRIGTDGSSLGANNDLDGWMDEIRVSKGTDRGWFNGFTPPTEAYSVEFPTVRLEGLAAAEY